jgi:F0F1-type ATP synthase beta subunit
MTVLSAGRHTETPVSREAFQRAVRALGDRAKSDESARTLLETGIKVVDVMCPLVSGGTVAIAGEIRTGVSVVVEELVRRLSGGSARVSLFTIAPNPPGSFADVWKAEGYSEGTVGSVQTFYFLGEEGPWSAERLEKIAGVDVIIRLSREVAQRRFYPAVDPLTSRSRLLERGMVSSEHLDVAARGRRALALLAASPEQPPAPADEMTWRRARKLQRFFAQPFFVAEPYTKRPGSYVALPDTLRGCRAILDGECDEVPEEAFYFTGTLEDVLRAADARRGGAGAATSGGTAAP